MTVLALDLSSHLGWAAGVPGERLRFGVWELPSQGNLGRQAAAYSDALADAITGHQPSLIIMECDVSLHRQNPNATALQQLGMVYLTELICYRRDIELRQATASDARTKMLKRARWSQKGECKTAVLAWCNEQGYAVTDHNAADAIVLWHYACAMRMRVAA